VPRKAKGPRLYLRRLRASGSWWVILDGKSERGTGCREHDLAGAEKELARYIASKYQPARRAADRLEQILIADVVNVYLRERAPHTANPSFIAATAEPILAWWGRKTLADIRGNTCREYVTWRTSQTIRRRKVARKVSESTARHDLKTLRAAIRHFHAEYGPLPSEPKITLPDAAPSKERWLTKAEAARFVRAAYRQRSWHVLRFLLIGLHTATRNGAILSLRWLPSTSGGWIDVERGLLHRRAVGAKETKKRQPPARIPAKLLPWLRHWRAEDARTGATYVINYDGKGVGKLRRSWATVRAAAGFGSEVTPHTLRHTAVCWQLQAGVDAWEVAGWAGMTVEIVDRVYGHHSADFQRNIGRRG
jgi:integrase